MDSPLISARMPDAPLVPGVHPRTPFDEYRAAAGVNHSLLRTIMHDAARQGAGTLADARDYLDSDDDDSTREMRFGSAYHASLDPDGPDVIIGPEYNRRSSTERATFAAFRAEHEAAGEVVVEYDEGPTLLAMLEAMHEQRTTRAALEARGEAEVACAWRMPEPVIEDVFAQADEPEPLTLDCKARVDKVVKGTTLIDWKTTNRVRDPRGWGFARWFADRGYASAAAWYVDGWQAATGRLFGMVYVIQEREEPYRAVVLSVSDDWLAFGRSQYREAFAALCGAIRTGEWPAWPDSVLVPEPTPAMLARRGIM